MDLSPRRPGAFAVLAKAVLSGLAVVALSLVVWNGLLFAALKNSAFLPAAVGIMAAVLLASGAYLKWGAWPRAGREFRSAGARLNPVPIKTVLLALAAGWSTMAAGFCLYVAHRVTSGLGAEHAIALPQAPLGWLLAALAMGAIVAGSVEEVAVRGFMQGTLERRFGVVPAILISGLVWALFHTNHSYFGEEAFVWIGIFLGVSTMLGTMAYRTNSVLPGMAVHIGFDAAYFLSAGILQPRIAPIAFVQSIASADALMVVAGVLGVAALASWVAFVRTTRAVV